MNPTHPIRQSFAWEQELEFLSPAFCRGGNQAVAEIRAASMRGMVRWWFRALGGTAAEEKAVFGGISHATPVASAVVFRVIELNASLARPDPATLLHATGGKRAPKAAMAAGSRFVLTVFSRRAGLLPAEAEKLKRALNLWTLLGSLGLRSNRGGGSVWPVDDPPTTPAELKARLAGLPASWVVALADPGVGTDAETLRKAATDTLEEPAWVFGFVKGRNREASPLKIKLVRLGGALRLLLAAPDARVLAEAERVLGQARKPLVRPGPWQRI